MRQKGNAGGEDGFVRILRKRFGKGDTSVRVGIGDDAAVVKGSSGLWVFSVDACVEGVHFDRSFVGWDAVGRRALGAALSDLAAMGAEPRYYLVSVEAPAGSIRHLMRVYSGFRTLEKKWGVRLIGGNVARGRRVALHTTVVGLCREGHWIRRDGAKPRDGLYVTGSLGSASLGLRLLRQGRKRHTKDDRWAIRKFLEPMPRFSEAAFLTKHDLASAGMDISDGLLIDLSRLCKEGGIGAAVQIDSIPRIRGVSEADALSGGEDYELLVAVGQEALDRLPAGARGRFTREFRRIGRIEARPGIRLHYPDGRIVIASRRGFLGWDHWKS